MEAQSKSSLRVGRLRGETKDDVRGVDQEGAVGVYAWNRRKMVRTIG